MESFLKRIKIELMITAVLYILLGLAVVIWPGASSGAFAVLLGILLVVSGVVHIASYFASEQVLFRSGLAVGALCVCFGAAIFAKTPLFSALLPFLFSTAVLISGVISVQKAVDLRRMGDRLWWLDMVMALVTTLLALLLFIYPFSSPRTFTIFIGLSLIYAGVSDLVIVLRSASFFNDVRDVMG